MPTPPGSPDELTSPTCKGEALTRFQAGLAHDLNNRLTILLGNLMLLETLLPGEKVLLADMQKAADEACTLVRLVQTFTRRDLFPPHPVEVGQTLRMLHDLLQRLLGDRVRLSLRLPDEPLYILADEGALEQLVAGLVGAMSPAETQRLYLETSNGKIFLRMEGEVSGEFPSHIHPLVSHLGGKLSVAPPGWELTFAEVDPGESLPRTPPPNAGGQTLLLAEGDPDLRDALARALAAGGFAVTPAADTTRVAELLAEGPPYDFAALDTTLPGGGAERLKELVGLPSRRVWLPPYNRKEPGLDGIMLPKPFPAVELHAALLNSVPRT